MVCWAGGGVCVPELRLQEDTTGVVEAAGVGDGGFVVAAQGVFEGVALLGEGEGGIRQEKCSSGAREE